MKCTIRTATLISLLLAASGTVAVGDESGLAERIMNMTRNTRAVAEDHVKLDFDAHHTQGMTRVGDRWFMTAVQTINRSAGIGKGHLFEFTDDGALLRSVVLNDGEMYHPGGIDFDGEHIWVCVAEYRPDSNTVVYRVDPESLDYEEVFRFSDHLGGIISVKGRNELIGVSWGSRRFYKWKVDLQGNVADPENPERKDNPSHFIDYQDGQWLKGTKYVVMGGLASYATAPGQGGRGAVGGIAVLDVSTMTPVFELPIPLYSENGRIMNQNPFYVSESRRGIRVHFVPDDNDSTLYRYEFRVRD